MISKATERRGVPLRAMWDEYEQPPFLARAALAVVRHGLDPGRYSGAEEIARKTWPGDQTTLAIIQRAASSPTSTTNAVALTRSAIGEFLASLAPISAAASLFAAGPRVDLGRLDHVTFPHRAPPLDANAVSWVDEGSPARVPRLDIIGGSTLGPTKKLVSIVAMTRELAEASDAEGAIDLLLRESAAFSLDVSVFSAIAGTSARPAGLLTGIAALTPAASTGGKDAAMDDDLAALAGAVGTAAAGLAFVMNPVQANAVKTRRGTQWSPDIPIWSTIGVAAGNVIALDPVGVVSAFGDQPEIRTVREASIAFDDSVPAEIVGGGQPAKSLFQVDAIALQLRLRAAWCLRTPGAVAWTSGVTW